MPTHDKVDRFAREHERLTPQQRAEFKAGVAKFIEDLRRMESDPSATFRPGLRVKPYLSGLPGDLEMTWADNGRAIFRFGEPVVEGKRHVVWLRVGTHDIF